LALLPGLYTLFEPWGRDQGIFAAVALGIDHGLVPYRDLYELKPPLTHLLYWLSLRLFGPEMWGIRALDLAIALATGLLSGAALVRLGAGRTAGLLAAPFLLFSYASADFWHRAQTDGWTMLPVAAALLLLAGPPGRHPPWRAAGAGACLGLVALLKYPCLAQALALAPLLLAGAERRRAARRALPWIAGGALAVLAAAAGLLAATGALGPFLEIGSFVLGYAAQSRPLAERFAGLALLLAGTPVVTLAALAGALAGGPSLARTTLLAWAAGAALSAFLQGKGFAYHWLPLAAPLAGLAALAAERIRRPVRTAALAVLAAGLSLAAVRTAALAGHLLEGGSRRTWYAQSYRGADFSAADTLAAASALGPLGPGESLFVWGYEAMIYPLAGVPPRHRYLFSWPFVAAHYDGRYDADLLARLAADPPARFVVQHDDAAPIATGSDRDSRAVLAASPLLSAFLARGYCRRAALPRFEIWDRRPDPDAGPASGPACPPP
jgi:hypothetical protein